MVGGNAVLSIADEVMSQRLERHLGRAELRDVRFGFRIGSGSTTANRLGSWRGG